MWLFTLWIFHPLNFYICKIILEWKKAIQKYLTSSHKSTGHVIGRAKRRKTTAQIKSKVNNGPRIHISVCTREAIFIGVNRGHHWFWYLLLSKSMLYTDLFLLFWIHLCNSANDTFEPRVSTKSSTTPVACGYRREVHAFAVTPEESTVCLG